MFGNKERGTGLSWAERALFRAVYWTCLFLMKILKVIGTLLILSLLALFSIFAWLALTAII